MRKKRDRVREIVIEQKDSGKKLETDGKKKEKEKDREGLGWKRQSMPNTLAYYDFE